MLRATQTVASSGRFAVLLALALLTIASWTLTVYQARSMNVPMGIAVRGGVAVHAMAGMSGMAGMAMSGVTGTEWSVGGALAFLGVWTVMMTAMMLPAVTPVLLLFGTIHSKRQTPNGIFGPTWMFAAGYLVVWSAIGMVTYVLVQIGSDIATGLGSGSRATWAPLVLGATLGVAGIYQLTPLKRACLGHCRSPFGFVMQHWRDGPLGALRMGVSHGAYCLGCCWALFAVLVAAGLMSLAWMVLLTLVVFAEKVFPHGERAAVGVGIALIVLGALVATGAAGMPWSM